MRIFTITMTPMGFPYDDGPKNIVFGVASRLVKNHFYFIASWKKRLPSYSNITFIASPFQKAGRHHMTWLQKIFICIVIMTKIKRVDVFQFFFTPKNYFSSLMKRVVCAHKKKSIQILSSVHTLLARQKPETVRSLFFADRVIVHSDYARSILTGAGVENITRIYPGIDTQRFQSGKSKNNFFGPTTHPYVVYPGTYTVLNDSYSLDQFCKIAFSVIKKNGNVRFVMACRLRTKRDSVLKNRFKSLLKNYAIDGNFELLDTVEDMPSLFSSVTAGIMPAQRVMVGILEIPLVLLELSALGKPVVYGGVNPFEELEAKGIGLRVTEQSCAAYADALLRLLEDKHFSALVGKRSSEAARKYFDIDATAQDYQKIYDSLAEGT